MSQVNQIQIKCLKEPCGIWFPSPFFSGDSNSFDTSTLVGNTAKCPSCGAMIPCNTENMRVRTKGQDHVGIDI
jgi:hypothetical protein